MSDEKQTRIRCWPWSHEWNKWKAIDTGYLNLTDANTGKVLTKTGAFEYQCRECEICGLSELRRATT